MRYLLPIIALSLTLFAFDFKGDIGVGSVNYSNYTNETLAKGGGELLFTNGYFNTNVSLEFLYSSVYEQRRYLLLNELYISKDLDEYTFSVGKRVKFWGEMEGFNITDVYNQKNFLKDPFDKYAKLGSIGVDMTRYFDENILEVGAKFYEEDMIYPQNTTPFAPFPLKYNSALELSDERYSPTIYLKANIIGDGVIDSETALILLHGYDNKRYFIVNDKYQLSQMAYRVNKALLHSHALLGDTIIKTELAYSDVISDDEISDYIQLSFGLEHTLYDLFGGDLALFGEYYSYHYLEDGKIEGVDISELYDNDIFLALRFNFNDVRSSDLRVGGFKGSW